jgi:hypothetical protein
MDRNLIAQGLAPSGHSPTKPATIQGFEQVFQNIISVAIAIAGLGLFIMLIMGGFNYINSGGDPQKAGAARNTLTFAILGLVFIALAYLFLRAIAVITGVNNILNFTIVQPN